MVVGVQELQVEAYGSGAGYDALEAVVALHVALLLGRQADGRGCVCRRCCVCVHVICSRQSACNPVGQCLTGGCLCCAVPRRGFSLLWGRGCGPGRMLLEQSSNLQVTAMFVQNVFLTACASDGCKETLEKV